MSDRHHHEHTHNHHGGNGLLGTIATVLHLPGFGHSHDHGYSDLASDRAFHDNELGIRTVWLALGLLAITTVLQVVIYIASGSVALLADTVHNFGDAANSIPLLIAFYLARRVATTRYTYGYGRAEDIAGVFIVISIAFSAGYILWESLNKLIAPQPLTNLPWLALAAVVGFIGNELVALMQIRVGRQIGSDAMIADGQHARVDGLTSLAVLGAVFGALIGVPVLDPIIGIVIGVAIVGITWNATKSTWYRLMDAVDPHMLHHMQHAIEDSDGVVALNQLRARWVGHRLYADVVITLASELTIGEANTIVHDVKHRLTAVAPHLDDITVEVITEIG